MSQMSDRRRILSNAVGEQIRQSGHRPMLSPLPPQGFVSASFTQSRPGATLHLFALQRSQWATAKGIARPKQNARTGRAAEWAPKEPPTANECALHPVAQAPGRISDCPPGGIPRRLIPAAPALHEEYGGKASSNERPLRPAESTPIRSSLVPTGFRPDHCLGITSRVDTPLMPPSLRPALIRIPAPHPARLQRAGPLRTPPMSLCATTTSIDLIRATAPRDAPQWRSSGVRSANDVTRRPELSSPHPDEAAYASVRLASTGSSAFAFHSIHEPSYRDAFSCPIRYRTNRSNAPKYPAPQ